MFACLEKLGVQSNKFKLNSHLLAQIADFHWKSGNLAASQQYFTKIRRIDPDVTDRMDIYCYLLKRQGNDFAVHQYHLLM